MKKASVIITAAGILLLCAALILTVYNIADISRAERDAGEAWRLMNENIISDGEDTESDTKLWEVNPNISMPTVTIDGREYIGTLEIPSVNVRLAVISEWDYSGLRVSPCRYSGSAYLDNMVIAGHNYSSHFGSLKNLSTGDEVNFTDAEGNRFVYRVIRVDILQPTDIQEMITEDDWNLSLFTCTFGGQARVTVRCVRV